MFLHPRVDKSEAICICINRDSKTSARRRLIQNFFQTPKRKTFEKIWQADRQRVGVGVVGHYVGGAGDDVDDDNGDSDDSFDSDGPFFALVDHVINTWSTFGKNGNSSLL